MKPIAVGDLVQVVRTVCCAATLGTVFKVGDIDASVQRYRCVQCGVITKEQLVVEAWSPNALSAPLSCCKRIPPLDELEGIQTAHDLDVKEPA